MTATITATIRAKCENRRGIGSSLLPSPVSSERFPDKTEVSESLSPCLPTPLYRTLQRKRIVALSPTFSVSVNVQVNRSDAPWLSSVSKVAPALLV